MTRATFNELYFSKKSRVTNKESGYKYTILFRLDKEVFEAKAYYLDDEEAEYMYGAEAFENETADDFIKRVKNEVKNHEYL